MPVFSLRVLICCSQAQNMIGDSQPCLDYCFTQMKGTESLFSPRRASYWLGEGDDKERSGKGWARQETNRWAADFMEEEGHYLTWSNLWGTGKPSRCSVLGLEALEPGSHLFIRLFIESESSLRQELYYLTYWEAQRWARPSTGWFSGSVIEDAGFSLCASTFFSSWVPSRWPGSLWQLWSDALPCSGSVGEILSHLATGLKLRRK